MERTRGHPALLVSPPCQHTPAPASPDQAPQPSGSGGIAMFYLAKGQHVALASREEENEVPDGATNLPKVLQKHFSHPKQNAPKSRVRTVSQGTEPGVLQPRQISSQHQSPPVRVAQSPRHSSLAELRVLPGPNPSRQPVAMSSWGSHTHATPARHSPSPSSTRCDGTAGGVRADAPLKPRLWAHILLLLPAALCPPCRAPTTLCFTKLPRGAPGRTRPTRPRLRDHAFQTRNRIPGDSPRDDAVTEEAPQGSLGCSPGTTKEDAVVCREPQSDRGCDSHKSPRKAAGRRLRSVLHPLRSGRHPGEREGTRGSSSAR